MKRFALAALTFAALGSGMIDGRPAFAQSGGYRPAPAVVEVQYRPYHRSDRPYYSRQERRAERRAWRRERERQVARQGYRAGRRDAYYGRGRY
jgi:hypothetical protein